VFIGFPPKVIVAIFLGFLERQKYEKYICYIRSEKEKLS
jgi:hypothetical protein